jgi:hypothetical protein
MDKTFSIFVKEKMYLSDNRLLCSTFCLRKIFAIPSEFCPLFDIMVYQCNFFIYFQVEESVYAKGPDFAALNQVARGQTL